MPLIPTVNTTEPTTATTLAGFAGVLPPHIAEPYFALARRSSVLQTLGKQVPLSINGEAVPVVTSKASASWVGEGSRKPLSNGTLGLLTMKPQKIASIAVVSAEVVRANPDSYVELFKQDIAEAMGQSFDTAGFHGVSSPFAKNLDQTTKSVTIGTATQVQGGVYQDLVSGMKLLAADGKRLRGFAFDGLFEPTLLSSVDTTGKPVWSNADFPGLNAAPDTAPIAGITNGRLLNRPALITDVDSAVQSGTGTGAILGYGGDFSQVIWGAVGGITYDVSTEATVTINGVLTSLWEHNLVAIRAEAEFGLLINDSAAFVKYVSA